ncbi:MAG: zinc ribbon domain-containing protein [Clostridia bacterium]|nr:zinc ribbon domain-containing protein [Clostridia bacterium]
MPIYEYECEKCGNIFDELVKDANEKVVCPRCRAAARRSYSGKVYTATGKTSGGCSGNCSACQNRCR